MPGEQRKKNDLRVRYTKKILKECLLFLLETKTIERITVKELCELAKINRTTFYTHYTDIYDLVRQMKSQMTEYILLHIESYSHIDNADKKASLIELLRYLRENRALYSFLGLESGPDSLRERAWYLTKKCYLNAEDSTPPPGNHWKELSLLYKTYGNTAVIKSWLRNDVPISEEELADVIVNF